MLRAEGIIILLGNKMLCLNVQIVPAFCTPDVLPFKYEAGKIEPATITQKIGGKFQWQRNSSQHWRSKT